MHPDFRPKGMYPIILCTSITYVFVLFFKIIKPANLQITKLNSPMKYLNNENGKGKGLRHTTQLLR